MPELSNLSTAIHATALTALFSLHGGLTVFAPTNAAFAAAPPGTLERLLDPANAEDLVYFLEYHLAAGAVRERGVYSQDLANHERIQMFAQSTVVSVVDGSLNYDVGTSVEITLLDGAVFVDQSRVLQANIPAHNGAQSAQVRFAKHRKSR